MTDLILPPGITWRHGEWQSTQSDVEPDVVCTDAPYGQRTHEGYRSGADAADESGVDEYSFWTPDHVMEFVRSWSPRTRGWMCCFTSHDLIPAWERAFFEAGRLAFVPLPCIDEVTPHAAPCAVVPAVVTGMGVRLQGDGPGNWTLQLVVARPRTLKYSKWCKEHRTPEPYYIGPAVRGSRKGRGKPEWLLKAVLRDYSKVGDLVVDPCGGWATTGTAAAATGRRFDGSEVEVDAYEKGRLALSRVQVADLFDPGRAVQSPLFGMEASR